MTSSSIRLLLVTRESSDEGIRQLLGQTNKVSFDVHLAQDLASAFEQLGSADFDIILLDLALANLEGIQAFLEIRQQAAHIPTVVVSSLYDEALALEALKAGAQDYL